MKPSEQHNPGIFLKLALPVLIIAGLLGGLLQWSLGDTLILAGAKDIATPTASLVVPSSTPTVINMPLNSVLSDPTLPNPARPPTDGVLVLALQDGANIHLFAYAPFTIPLRRITHAPFDDADPAVSPDVTHLAYVSRQNGYWDLFVIDLTTGQNTRITDTPETESAPTWSPDGQLLAYQRFDGGNTDIYILPLAEGNNDPIRLTDSPGVDSAPAWSPQGRKIAFVSDRSGDEEIWLADLDQIDHRFTNLSNNPRSQDRYPAWSPDGLQLAWASEIEGERQIALWRAAAPDWPAAPLGVGDRPTWGENGSIVWSEIKSPNQNNLSAITVDAVHHSTVPASLPSETHGMTWVRAPLPSWLAAQITLSDTANVPQPPLQQLSHLPAAPVGRMALVKLDDVAAPQPYLHDAVDESFIVLRQQIAYTAGWDALSSLENAFVPITTPNDPGLQEDWLFTGRGFAINPLLLSAGWMAIVQEPFGGQIYWRVFLRARYQDGSMGQPIDQMIWDLNARYTGDPHAYEIGGRLAPAPAGYWIDFTSMAMRNGWERIPSFTNWKTYYPAIRYNQFVITDGLDWYTAMREIYPSEAMATATPMPTPTVTPLSTEPTRRGPTKSPTITRTATATPTSTQAPTRRPTWTPLAQP